MASFNETAAELLNHALEACKAEYAEHHQRWRHLDSKAQGVVASAGIFLAAAFAFVRDLTAATNDLYRVLLTIVLLLLGSSVLYSIRALRIRKVDTSPPGNQVAESARLLLQQEPEEIQSRVADFIGSQLWVYEQVNRSTATENSTKGLFVFKAQMFLIAALGGAAALTLAVITGWA